MRTASGRHSVSRWLALGAGVIGTGYAACASYAWLRFGKCPQVVPSSEADALLDQFIPNYEIVERHAIRVRASADITFEAARDLDFQDSPAIRAIFRTREWFMGAQPPRTSEERRGLIEQLRGIGWGVLAEIPHREIVMGAVTAPWDANPVFRALPPDEFRAFDVPGQVKIAW